MSLKIEFAEVGWNGRSARIEHAWIGRERQRSPLLLFLHEGLGSLSMWKDFPQQLCARLGCRGLVYSRPGYGRSTPRPAGERWLPDFLHRQANELLPALLAALKVDAARDKPWLFGHSDGASIALLHAARHPEAVAGAIVLAPHIDVEAKALASIGQARQAYLQGDLRERLARHHDDADSAFWGWNDVWLSPAFRSWSIEGELGSIRCPLLAVQGLDDEYGTLAQIHRIAQHVPQTETLELPDCGHSPHRDQPERLIEVADTWVRSHCTPPP